MIPRHPHQGPNTTPSNPQPILLLLLFLFLLLLLTIARLSTAPSDLPF